MELKVEANVVIEVIRKVSFYKVQITIGGQIVFVIVWENDNVAKYSNLNLNRNVRVDFL